MTVHRNEVNLLQVSMLGWASGAHDADITSINHKQEAFGDLEVIIALYALLSIQSTQQRPVCKDMHPSFYKGHIILQSPDLGYTE